MINELGLRFLKMDTIIEVKKLMNRTYSDVNQENINLLDETNNIGKGSHFNLQST